MIQKIAIERVDHIGIRVRDLERALNFYRALAGCGKSQHHSPDMGYN